MLFGSWVQPRIQVVTQTVPQKIETQYGDENGQPRKNGDPRGGKELFAGVGQHPPQLGVGGWVPKPKKESAASTRMAPAIPNVAITRMGPTMLGRIWVNIMRNLP